MSKGESERKVRESLSRLKGRIDAVKDPANKKQLCAIYVDMLTDLFDNEKAR